VEKKMKHVIYLDMDGVLANFEGKAIELFGTNWKTEVEADRWGKFADYQNIYEILDPMPDALELYNGCCEIIGNKTQVQILTALPNRARFDRAAQDKINWARRYIDPDIRVAFGPHAQDKQYHIRHTNDVLVDDMIRNVEQWKARGGVGVLHTSAASTLDILQLLWNGGQL